jgi:5-methylcytosine-specific restriction protein A
MMIPLKPCSYPGCNKLVKSGRCESHRRQADKKYDKERENEPWRQWIHSTRYRVAISIYKSEHPLCERCEKVGKVVPVYIVHHKIQHKGNWELFWSRDNWESVCNDCHEAEHGKDRFKRRW